MREPLLEGMSFALKYLGMTLVEKPKGEEMAAAAIHRILATARVGNKKFQKVILTVSPRGLSLQDAETQDTIACISIYRISYCTTDKLQNKVFAYVAQNPQSGALECHAFLSPKKKVAQAVTLTVAQAFHVALDLWDVKCSFVNGGEYMSIGGIPVSLYHVCRRRAGRPSSLRLASLEGESGAAEGQMALPFQREVVAGAGGVRNETHTWPLRGREILPSE
nr:low density lipoprotein receptor adapter protein 1-like [Pogona vitticeps]